MSRDHSRQPNHSDPRASSARVALITGASRGLGRGLASALARDGWSLVITARGAEALEAARRELAASGATVSALAGDVADAAHRRALADLTRERFGHLDALVNNASVLGPSPQPALTEYPAEALAEVYRVNVVAPLALAAELAPLLGDGARVVNVSSDAAVEPYAGWGGYGSSKAALDHASAILAAERPAWRVYAADPGDMRTQMHQEAFPGEDISDRPEPEVSVPGLLTLLQGWHASGRYKVRDVSAAPARGVAEAAGDPSATSRPQVGGAS